MRPWRERLWEKKDFKTGIWKYSTHINRSAQPGHPPVGRRNEYQPKGGDAVRLGSKGKYGS